MSFYGHSERLSGFYSTVGERHLFIHEKNLSGEIIFSFISVTLSFKTCRKRLIDDLLIDCKLQLTCECWLLIIALIWRRHW